MEFTEAERQMLVEQQGSLEEQLHQVGRRGCAQHQQQVIPGTGTLHPAAAFTLTYTPMLPHHPTCPTWQHG